MNIITQRGNLAESVAAQLLERVDSGIYGPGDKLPSSTELCKEFGVSRTVVREALASLKLGRRVISRQGAGVFVAERDTKAFNFEIAKVEDVRSAMQILEFRMGVELQSVTLAASRRTPAALAEIASAYDRMATLNADDTEAQANADFDFHLAIAKATRNPHFPHFLEAVMAEVRFDLLLKHRMSLGTHDAYLKKIHREHSEILVAITQGDRKAAEWALRLHLEESLGRYKQLLEAHP